MATFGRTVSRDEVGPTRGGGMGTRDTAYLQPYKEALEELVRQGVDDVAGVIEDITPDKGNMERMRIRKAGAMIGVAVRTVFKNEDTELWYWIDKDAQPSQAQGNNPDRARERRIAKKLGMDVSVVREKLASGMTFADITQEYLQRVKLNIGERMAIQQLAERADVASAADESEEEDEDEDEDEEEETEGKETVTVQGRGRKR